MACPRAELSIAVLDDAEICTLNATYRGKSKATDVLSFSQLEGISPDAGLTSRRRAGHGATLPVDPKGFVGMLGDVVISADTAWRNAEARGDPLDDEMQRLLVHGILHLLGHDHVRGGWPARRMREQETLVLRRLKRLLPKS